MDRWRVRQGQNPEVLPDTRPVPRQHRATPGCSDGTDPIRPRLRRKVYPSAQSFTIFAEYNRGIAQDWVVTVIYCEFNEGISRSTLSCSTQANKEDLCMESVHAEMIFTKGINLWCREGNNSNLSTCPVSLTELFNCLKRN